MLQITIPAREWFDESKQEFLYTKEQTLQLEHSLVSLSKWEARWEKPFLGKENKTREETIDYIRCMTITKNVDPNVYYAMTEKNLNDITSYISAKRTATWFSNDKRSYSRETVTSELIYYWMIALGIPFECQRWHLNRLLTLIQICNIKNAPSKKMGTNKILAQNKALNNARKAKYNTKG